MSNHSGSYMINSIIKMLEQEAVFEHLGKDISQTIVLNILKIADNYDCNPGEILDEIGERLGICFYCQQVAEKFGSGGVCQSCYDRDFAQ